jgi:hypothetical protein
MIHGRRFRSSTTLVWKNLLAISKFDSGSAIGGVGLELGCSYCGVVVIIKAEKSFSHD